MRLIGAAAWLSTALLLTNAGLLAQEKSVRPGINDAFKDPDIQEWVKKFEVESREVYEQRKQIVAACKIQPGQSVADIGAGTGLFTRLFADAVGQHGTVYAVDIAQKFLDHISASAKQQGIHQVKTILGTDTSPKLPDRSVDVVFLCDTYHHFEFPQRMLTAIHRALKPGGRLIVIDFIRIEGKSSDWILKHVRAGQEVVEREIGECGFRKTAQVDGLLRENYFVIFDKIEPDAKTGK